MKKNKKLEADFAQAYRFIRDLFISEMVDSEFKERDVLGYDIDTLKGNLLTIRINIIKQDICLK